MTLEQPAFPSVSRSETADDRAVYDVAIVGGALAGAATAMLLLQKNPALRVVIIERSAEFERRVGESTIEISTFFLLRQLGLAAHLNEHHFCKQGLRFFFSNDEVKKFDDCSEIGGRFLTRVPAFMVDRAVLDEEVLRRAGELGAEIRRPVQNVQIDLAAGGRQRVTVRVTEGAEEVIDARWVVDASGVRAQLARQEGWFRQNEEHPTAAIWSRWTGVKNLDGPELRAKFPEWSDRTFGMRHTATNHAMGEGWWAWFIPLKGGDVSIGVTYDQRFVTLPPGPSVGERLRSFLRERSPFARELLSDARPREDDVHFRKNLPYFSTTFAGDGFANCGGCGGFYRSVLQPGHGLDRLHRQRRSRPDPRRTRRRNRHPEAARTA